MSEHTQTPEPLTARPDELSPYDLVTEDREMERLENLYREALETRGQPRIDLMKQAVAAIRKARGDKADDFILSIDRTVENERDVDYVRAQLANALLDADRSVTVIGKALERAQEKRISDPAIVDGDIPAIEAALTGVRLHLAALRHLTKDAKPEHRP